MAKSHEELVHEQEEREKLIQRRRFLQASLGVSVTLGIVGVSALSVTASLKPIEKLSPDKEPPKPGDRLVHAETEAELSLADVPLGGSPVLAYPKDPQADLVKKGDVKNLLLVLRFNPDELDEETRQHAADGVVVYSAVCTHLGCTVSQWEAAQQVLLCPCHKGLYDPKQGAKVVGGPPPRPLAALPVKLEGDRIVVNGEFTGPVGVVAGRGGCCGTRTV